MLLIITTIVWAIVVALYSVSELNAWYLHHKTIKHKVYTSLPYILVIFELVTSVGFAIVFGQLYHELKMLSEKTFAKIRYKTMTYLTLITMLTNTRCLYNLVLMLNNEFTPGEDYQFTTKSLMPSYFSELLQCLFVVWHIFTDSLPKSSRGPNSGTVPLYVVESDLAMSIGRRSYGKIKNNSYLKYSSATQNEPVIVQKGPNGTLYAIGGKNSELNKQGKLISFKRRISNGGNEELQMLVEDKNGEKKIEQLYELEEVIDDED